MKFSRIFLSLLLILTLSAAANAYTLSGDISGAEWFGGITYVYALSLDILNPSFYIGLALLGNGAYFIFSVPEGTYVLIAFQDRDGNLIPSIDDYMGYYGGAVPALVEVTGNVDDLDIEVEALPFTSISGAVSCPQGEFGLTYILAASDPDFEDVVGWTIPLTLDGNADYNLFIDPGEYYVMSYLDADFSFSRTSEDPQIFYGAPNYPILVDITGSSAENIDLPMMLPPDIELTLTPQGTPIVIPPGGGSFDYTIGGQNLGTETVVTQLWVDVTLPDGTPYGPIIGPANLTMPAGFSISRDRTQTVPGSAPAGQYSYNAYAGFYPAIVWFETSFNFEKLGVDANGALTSWPSAGDHLGGWEPARVSRPVESQAVNPATFTLCEVYPNPFNPTTTISFSLPEVMHVGLRVYNVSGREVATLANSFHNAGKYKITFDGSHLSSGVYLYSLEAGNMIISGKMILMK